MNSKNSTSIELSSVSTSLMAKSVIEGSSFTEEEAKAGIGLFLMDGSSIYGSNESNVAYFFTGNKWTASKPLRIAESKDASLYAYYPYNENVTDLKVIPLESSVDGKDYLFGNAEVTAKNAGNVSLTMNHALSRFKITLRKDVSYEGDCILSEISIQPDIEGYIRTPKNPFPGLQRV